MCRASSSCHVAAPYRSDRSREGRKFAGIGVANGPYSIVKSLCGRENSLPLFHERKNTFVKIRIADRRNDRIALSVKLLLQRTGEAPGDKLLGATNHVYRGPCETQRDRKSTRLHSSH